jgi:hypothetical protein
VTLEPVDTVSVTLGGQAIAGASSALVFKMGGTEFSATQGEGGDWQVVLKTACSAAQMVALAELVMADGLNLSLARFSTTDLISAE